MDETPHPPIQSLFLQHASALRGFVLGLTADRSAADDIVQEVFLTVVQREADFRRDGCFLAWARGIARNKVLEHHRRRRSTPLPFDDRLLELLVESAEAAQERFERRREALARCLERLAPRTRQIVELRYAERPLTGAELAERIGWTANAVHVALARARAFLRDCARQALAGGEAS